MKKRTKRLTAQWALAAQRLARKLGSVWRDQKQVLVLCAFRELRSESLGNELRAPGLQVGTRSALEKVLLSLFEFQLGRGRQSQDRRMWWPLALFRFGEK